MLRTALLFIILCVLRLRVVECYGYHLKYGVPKAMDVMRDEGLTRIIGGTPVNTADALPFQAGIIIRLTTGWTSLCGGGLISQTRVLTAAHCWWDGESQASLFTVVLGSVTIFSGGTRLETSDVTMQPNWNPRTLLFDIAIARISRVTISNTIQMVPLPTVAHINTNLEGLTGIVAGYGKTSEAQNSFPTSTALHQLAVQIIPNSVCQNSFPVGIHGSHLCTSGSGRVGTCEGDSGSPLTVVLNNQRTMVGIISFGPIQGCQAGLPSVYTRITTFLPWINSLL